LLELLTISSSYNNAANLDGFLDAVVDNEEHEDDLACQDEVVAGSDIAQKFDGT